MINQADLQIVLKKISVKMSELFNDKLKQIILFGSFARSEQEDDSDLDIMIIVLEDKIALKKYHDLVVDFVTDLELEYDVVISIILQNYDEYNNYNDILPFFANVKREGVLLYA